MQEVGAPNGPAIKAETWFAAAVASIIITIIIGGAAALWVFSAHEPALMVQRAQAFTPFGAALLAIVTFCTIAWRGVLNTTQLQHTADQLAQSRRQNDAKDEENLARLLMEGTKLLGDDKESHILAGIAALQAVVTSPKETYAPHAMDILADLVEATYNSPLKQKVFGACRDALERGADQGRQSSRYLKISFEGDEPQDTVAINGVRILEYQNARIDEYEYGRFREPKRVRFRKCELEYCEVTPQGSRMFDNCRFFNCDISAMSFTFIKRNDFERCDFSGAKYTGGPPPRSSEETLAKLLKTDNYYEADNPPIGRRIDWSKYLGVIVTNQAADPDEFDEA